ncbi:MAG: TIM barrel protein [Clostridiaceae bacterium]|nr:TIM barrel protein [Clostridiaceae bacterium]
MTKALFGPAGGSDAFSSLHKSSAEAPEYLAAMGLDCFEYQCGRGVNIGRDACELIGDAAGRHSIRMSLHSPYFINLSSADPVRIEKSIKYILDSARACHYMGGDRVVVHCGGLSGMSREQAMENTVSTLGLVLCEMEAQKLSHITLCIETMGKINVLGDFDEIMAICGRFEALLPCIDFGHLNSRTGGEMNSTGDFERLLRAMENAIGAERAKIFHAHFSKIQYSKGGEVRHLTFADKIYGPEFEPLGKLLAEMGFAPRMICESAGTQDIDALQMKMVYNKYREYKEEE